MTKTKVLGVCILAMGALLMCSLPMVAADSPQAIVQHATAYGQGHVTQSYPVEIFGLHEANPVRHIPKQYIRPTNDSVAQRPGAGPDTAEFNNNYSVLGVGVGFPNYSVPDAPPDTTMAVGDTEVVQGVNVSYADFNKSTGAVIPINGAESTLFYTPWHALIPNTLCGEHNPGDIIVKFDRYAPDAERVYFAVRGLRCRFYDEYLLRQYVDRLSVPGGQQWLPGLSQVGRVARGRFQQRLLPELE
jgi:hypothetical protein